MSAKRLLWVIPLTAAGIGIVVALLLMIAAACVLYVPSLRAKAIDKALVIAREKTGMDIEIGDAYLSPFHHSPLAFYRAYKGEEDLPLEIAMDSLFVGHRGQDTLVASRTLRLKAVAKTKVTDAQPALSQGADFLSIPIDVEQLLLEQTTFHSDSMIAAVGVDVIVAHLSASSPGMNIAAGHYPLPGLRLQDGYVGIDLRGTPPDTTSTDTVSIPMAFDVADGETRNLHFALTPLGMHIQTDTMALNVLADVGNNSYDARRLDIGPTHFRLAKLLIPLDTLYGDATVDLNSQLITSNGLHARSNELGAKADLATTQMNLETMRVDVIADADFKGSKAKLRGFYDIDEEQYDLRAEIEKVDLSAFLNDSPPIRVAGNIAAHGKGIDPHSPAMRSRLNVALREAVYDNIDVSGLQLEAALENWTVEGTLQLPFAMQSDSIHLSAMTAHRFRVARFMDIRTAAIDYHARMNNVHAVLPHQHFHAPHLHLDLATDDTTSIAIETEGLTAALSSPMHMMALLDRLPPLLRAVQDSAVLASITSLSNLTMLDTIRRLIPANKTRIALRQGSPVQHLIDSTGVALEHVNVTLSSSPAQTDLAVDMEALDSRIPASTAQLQIAMREGTTRATLNAHTLMRGDSASPAGLKTRAELAMALDRTGNDVQGTGTLAMNDLGMNDMDFGTRTARLALARSKAYPNAVRADVELDDIPLAIVDSIIHLADIELGGAVRAKATIDGLPADMDISAEVLPVDIRAAYTPYNVQLGLGRTPIVMTHNKVNLNGLPVYGADSTFIALSGGLNLDDMRLDVTLAADSFAPAKLVQGGPIPIYGDLATDIRGMVSGPLDSIVADVDVTILPSTDITYPIGKKNLAQVKPYGSVNVRYAMAADSLHQLLLDGTLKVDEGMVRYSPKLYPIMPFRIDSGSNVSFHGPLGQTLLNVSASQKVKADVESSEEETRRVDFTTGVRVNGTLDSIGLNAIGFFLEAPQDEQVTKELRSLDDDTREGLAATLLATGMYVGESNVAARREGYALSSIINSRINAAMANSKLGKLVDIDISSAQRNHAAGKSNDMDISISKSFFKDKLRVSVGTSISDNPEVYSTMSILNNISAEYKLTKEGNVLLRLYSQRDYNNVLEGELYKAGISVRAMQEWRRRERYRADSITRTYALTADAGVAYRSNNSIGPDLTLKSSIRNLMGAGETFTIKGNGAYYWALRNRHPGDPKKTDTYKFGIHTSLDFPYLHWASKTKPEGDTRYMFGYQYENIAGGYGVHKLSGGLTYFFHSARHAYITHAFTPFTLSVVLMKAESDSLLSKAAEYPQLIKLFAGNEFVPAIGYNFIYNDYRAKRTVNTMLNLGVKESGNLINALYALGGRAWNEKNKPLGTTTFNQFVKLTAELRNRYNITDAVSIATRLYAGMNIPLGNSDDAPLSEAFYTGGPNSMRAAAPYAYGPGNFFSAKYNQSFFHAGDVKLEANLELRFPIVWKLFGAAFVDAGNVWSWYSVKDRLTETAYKEFLASMQIPSELTEGIINNPDLLRQIALGTGAGLRLDIDGMVIRLDLGVAIHAPYQTYRYDKQGNMDTSRPITTYFNIPSALDALHLNFGIGYPF